MLRSTKFTLGIGGCMILGATALYVDRIIGVDAFAAYRGGRPLGAEIGMKMEGVQLEGYQGMERVMSAYVDQVDVRRDRQFYDLKGIRGFAGSKLDKIDFAAERASYDAIAKQLSFDTGTKIENKDFSLFLPQAIFDEKKREFEVPGIAAGTLLGGKTAISKVTYNVPRGELITGSIRWKGGLPKVVQDTPIGDDRSDWDFRSDKPSKTVKGVTTFQEVRATDGDVVIRAEKGVYDSAKDILTCTGKVYVYSKKANFVADKVTIYSKEKRAVFESNLRMLVKSKNQSDLNEEIPPFRPDVPDEILASRPAAPTPAEVQQQKDLDDALRKTSNIRDYPAVMVAEKVEYWYGKGKRRAIITGKPQCLQDFPGDRWRRISGFIAHYDGEADTVKIESQQGKKEVVIKTSIGDVILARFGIFPVAEDSDIQDWELDAPEGKFRPRKEDLPTTEKSDSKSTEKKETGTGSGTKSGDGGSSSGETDQQKKQGNG